MSSKAQILLDQIKADILSDNVCPDLAETAKNLVMGDGNPVADVVFIGEAPGKKEDEQGLPFVGSSGRFLNEMLDSIGMTRSEVYITNIVKYRPPNNRDPKPAEKAAFWPYLLRQLAVIDPKVIVTLGRHSMEYFIHNVKISEVHGHPISVAVELPDLSRASWVVLPLYHPAAALYNGAMRRVLIDDFMHLSTIVRSS